MIKRIAVLLACAGLLAAAASATRAATVRELVLVTAASSNVAPLTPAEVRRLFLGIPIYKEGVRLEPMHNVGDPLLYEVFLQKILFMSAQNYERQLLHQVFQAGGHRPARYSDQHELVGALQAKPGSVTFMWTSAQGIPGIKVVQALWQGPLE